MTRADFLKRTAAGSLGALLVSPLFIAGLIYAEQRGTNRNRALARKAAEADLRARKAYGVATYAMATAQRNASDS